MFKTGSGRMPVYLLDNNDGGSGYTVHFIKQNAETFSVRSWSGAHFAILFISYHLFVPGCVLIGLKSWTA